MKKKMFIVIMSLVISLTGCGSKTNGGSPKEKINIRDIVWNVDEGIADGKRYVLLDYTNNSDYTITSFKLTFKEKSDITK